MNLQFDDAKTILKRIGRPRRVSWCMMHPIYDRYLRHHVLAASSSQDLIELVLSTRQGTSERVEAAEILGYRHCNRAIPALLEMVQDGWYTDSVAAAEALAKMGDPTVVPHIARVYEECKANCSLTHDSFDAKRRNLILSALLSLLGEAELKVLLQQGDRLEGLLAGQELEVRRATRRLRELLSQTRGLVEAVIELHDSGEVQHWTIRPAVEAITGLPFEDSSYLVTCALRGQNHSEPDSLADDGV